ncbi:hypothetical protein VTN77DRAFT_1691 [Rasamsonia byssochlamydoides]|uniref:uncharacterized protein n=1 Tax=Rasamsonia byssochlamydoides TaxID=89139 RepID=UPI003743483D
MSPNNDSQDPSPLTYQPVVPVDLVGGYRDHRMSNPTPPEPAHIARSSSGSSSGSSLKSPRTARFAEATTVISPVGPSENGQSPFADPPAVVESQPHVSDVGFGYVADNDASRHVSHPPLTPASPLRSALKTPGTARTLNPLSPTFREELNLEKQEKKTERENARDLKIKTRVRLAKVLLRCVNFSCSLIVLSLISTTFSIFNATKSLPPRNNLPPWAIGTNPWPQILLLVLSCVSLFTCLIVFWGYWRGGHRRAEKVGVYYSVFSVCFFAFSVIMWVVGAAVFQNAKASGGGQDLWGWSCNQNTRAQLFQQDVNYSLICRLQDWSLVCAIIEVVIEVIVILIYAVVFYRFYSKQRLRKTMDLRDKARSDLYLAQLRVQSAPNTPGFMPLTPKSPYMNVMPTQDAYSAAENGENYSVQYATPKSPMQAAQKPFQLQPPPIRVHHATPKPAQEGFAPTPGTAADGPSEGPAEQVNPHVGAAPGEKTYEAVPIPGAYTSPMASPSFAPPAGTAPPQ